MPETEKRDAGEVVPIPTLPFGRMMNEVWVEEPTTNWFASPARGLIASLPHGVEVPMPTRSVESARKDCVLSFCQPCQRRSDFASAGRSNIASVLNA